MRQLAAGRETTCAIKSDGTPACWGSAHGGVTTLPAGIGTVRQISVGNSHACAVKTDGTAVCWGSPSGGQTTVPAGLGPVTQVIAGTNYSCAIKADRTIACWGDDGYGQATPPAGTVTSLSAAADIDLACATTSTGAATCWGDDFYGQGAVPATKVLQVSAGYFHACAIQSDGTLACWGTGNLGQLSAPAGPFVAARVSTGEGHACAVKTTGEAACWGAGDDGQTTVPSTLGRATDIAAGSNSTCAVTDDGTPACWGISFYGLDGVPAGTGTVSTILAGHLEQCAIRSDGAPVCWGSGAFGSTTIPAGLGRVLRLGVGRDFACAIKVDGTPVCWGRNSDGQSTVPAGIGRVIDIAAGNTHACAVKADGTPVCWGSDALGQREVPAGVGAVRQIATGQDHTCVLTVDDHVACWGGYDGQTDIPADLGAALQVTAGAFSSCAVRADGTPRCWGANDSGQIGGPHEFVLDPPHDAGLAYYYALLLAPGGPPATYAVTSGALPPGLEILNGSLASIVGNATTEGTFTGTITAGDGLFTPDATQNFSIKVDLTAPAEPTLTATAPVSPSTSLTPTVSGTAEAGSTVSIYADDQCSGSDLATGTAAAFASPGLPITVPESVTTTLFATATDAVGNTSPCSTSSLTFRGDTTAPDAPDVTGLSVMSPGRDLTPKVSGDAELGTTVRLYTNAACTGSVAAVGTASAFATPGLATSVSADSTTTFSATATDGVGNVSDCSTSFQTYVNDRTPPATPTVTSSTPASPSTSLTPVITGGAEAGSTVDLYAGDCSSVPLATEAAGTFAGAGITVTVPANQTTTIRATATDAAGNTSPCSASALVYRHDTTAPSAPSFDQVSFTGQSLAPSFRGSAEPGSTVHLYAAPTCTGGALVSGSSSSFGGPGLSTPAPANGSVTVYATATDAVGNISDCSTGSTYLNDTVAPAAPVIAALDTGSPGRPLMPKVTGTAETGSTLRLYSTAACSDAAIGSGGQASFGAPGITATVAANSVTTIYGTATDAAGNTSACSSTSVTYVNDRTAPARPTFSAPQPASPSQSRTVVLTGVADAGSTVRIYDTAGCTGAAVATLSAADFATPGATITVAGDSSTTFQGTAVDSAGNVTSCSSSFASFVSDRTPPAEVTFTGSTPASPSHDFNPAIRGTAEDGSTVRLYDTTGCTGPPLAGGTAAAFASPGLTVTVPPNGNVRFRAVATDAAGNSSVCSALPLRYANDWAEPAAPTFSVVARVLAASELTPAVSGSAETGSTVRLYADATCSGEPVAIGSSDDFAVPGLAITVAPGTTTTLYATATDAATNVSACSPNPTTLMAPAAAATPGPAAAAPVAPAPVAAPPGSRTVDALALSGYRVTGARIALSLVTPSAGQLDIRAAVTVRGKTLTYAMKRKSTPLGVGSATLTPTGAARRALAKVRSVKVRVRIRFTPQGGPAVELRKTIVVKGTRR